MWFLDCCVLTDGLLGTWHTSCLVIPIFTAARYDVYIPLVASPVGFLVVCCLLVLFCCWFLFGWCVFGFCFSFGGCCFILHCGMTSYGFGTTNTRSLLRLASLAVISTASKHLHNDLAKAIKALEQKKIMLICHFHGPYVFLYRQLFTANAIARTELSAISATPEKKWQKQDYSTITVSGILQNEQKWLERQCR